MWICSIALNHEDTVLPRKGHRSYVWYKLLVGIDVYQQFKEVKQREREREKEGKQERQREEAGGREGEGEGDGEREIEDINKGGGKKQAAQRFKILNAFQNLYKGIKQIGDWYCADFAIFNSKNFLYLHGAGTLPPKTT